MDRKCTPAVWRESAVEVALATSSGSCQIVRATHNTFKHQREFVKPAHLHTSAKRCVQPKA